MTSVEKYATLFSFRTPAAPSKQRISKSKQKVETSSCEHFINQNTICESSLEMMNFDCEQQSSRMKAEKASTEHVLQRTWILFLMMATPHVLSHLWINFNATKLYSTIFYHRESISSLHLSWKTLFAISKNVANHIGGGLLKRIFCFK